MSPFFRILFARYPVWQQLPVVERPGDGWCGIVLTVPAPEGADLVGPLDIEEVGSEITIALDYSHGHYQWPIWPGRVSGDIWADAIAMIDGILSEKVMSVSGWTDGELRVASFQEVGKQANLIVPRLQHVCTRSWKSTFDCEGVSEFLCVRLVQTHPALGE